MGGYPLFVESADGCTVLDVDGNYYLDCNNHHTTLMLGHSPPAVVAALQDQLSSEIAFRHATALEAGDEKGARLSLIHPLFHTKFD